MEIIRIEHLSKAYVNNTYVLDDISLTIHSGEFVVLVGPSGCGKTTLLKMINKLIPLSSGTIFYEGKKLSEWDTIELRRNIGYVIQQVGLFPHMNIEKNIGYVPSIQGLKAQDYHSRVVELIKLVGLEEADLKKFPNEISGGQAQRIGVARALAANPDMILMDEPFGAVDEITRRNLQEEIKHIHQSLKKTILFVTHDIGEAIRLADRIILFNNGKIEQMGKPEEIVFKPKTDFVKSFFGARALKESLDEEKLENYYEDILSGKADISDFLCDKKKV
jgi:osmoprotectant transport system ATP-binding protein